jgi:hypothetical protein
VLSYSSLATELGSAPTTFAWSWTGGGGQLTTLGSRTLAIKPSRNDVDRGKARPP